MTTETEFRSALLNGEAEIPSGLQDGAGRPAGRRYSVYRNNVAVSLTDALETGFPAVAKLLGQENFRNVAGVFLRQQPPSSPLMMHYGAGFPVFLEGFPPLKTFGYLGDVARLELALRQSYHASDSAPADVSALQAMDESTLLSCHMTLAPSVRILRSPWPALSLWRFNMVPGAPKPAAQAEDTLILRPEYDPEPHFLPPGGAIFLDSLSRDLPFGEALTAAQSEHPDFDLGGTLNLALAHGAVTELKTGAR